MIHIENDLTGHWFICDTCGKTDTFNVKRFRDEAAEKHICIPTATLVPAMR